MNNDKMFAENGDKSKDNHRYSEDNDGNKETMKYEFALVSDLPQGWGKRHSQILLGSVCVCLAFIIKTNISVAIIAMTDHKYDNTSMTFNWDKKTQNTVSSAFFFGYLIMMIPFGIIAHKFGGKIPIIACLGLCSVFSFLFPILTEMGGWITACALRFMQGLAIASILPCLHNMIGKWSPMLERGRATAYIHTGAQFGKVLTMAVSGYLSTSSVGWPLIFYLSGLCAFVGCLLMWWLGAESPKHHPTISQVEFDYIKSTSGGNAGQKKLKTPWKMIFKNIPFWAIVSAQCGYLWHLSTTLIEIPAYMNSILGVNIKNNGLLSAAPYIAMCMLTFVGSNLFDYLLKRRTLTITAARKISNTIGMWVSGALLVAFCFTPAEKIPWAMFLLVFSIGTLAGTNSGFIVALTDITPNFSGSTLSIGAAFGNFFGAMAGLVNGSILTDMNDVGQWRAVFGLSAGLMFVTNLIFVIFATSKVQPWNNKNDGHLTNCDL